LSQYFRLIFLRGFSFSAQEFRVSNRGRGRKILRDFSKSAQLLIAIFLTIFFVRSGHVSGLDEAEWAPGIDYAGVIYSAENGYVWSASAKGSSISIGLQLAEKLLSYWNHLRHWGFLLRCLAI